MLEIKNYMEDLVEGVLEEVLGQIEMCKCQKCRNDICAIALNNLKPIYAASQKGKVFIKINMLKQQSQADVLAEVTRAAKKVAQDMKHEE